MCTYFSTPGMVLDVREVFFRSQGFGSFQNSFVITYFSFSKIETMAAKIGLLLSRYNVLCIVSVFFGWFFGCAIWFPLNIFFFSFFLWRHFYFKYLFNLKKNTIVQMECFRASKMECFYSNYPKMSLHCKCYRSTTLATL